MFRRSLLVAVVLLLAASPVPIAAAAEPRPAVHVVLFTHIEDNTPAGVLGSPSNRTAYLNLRDRLLALAGVVRLHGVGWSLQPDWKFLLAVERYETPEVTSLTGGLNLLRYLRESMGVSIDPHSHENGGYNYTDVAHLLHKLGVGGSTVIGGHIWDPALSQFQRWDRFRAPVPGLRFPEASWRGDILMGSGSPNHVNDPLVSGVWRPRDRDAYFADDPVGNIVAVGAFRGDLPGISELAGLYRSGRVSAECLLTASYSIRPVDILGVDGIRRIEDDVVRPLADLRDQGDVALTDFTALVDTWRQRFGARACVYAPTPGA